MVCRQAHFTGTVVRVGFAGLGVWPVFLTRLFLFRVLLVAGYQCCLASRCDIGAHIGCCDMMCPQAHFAGTVVRVGFASPGVWPVLLTRRFHFVCCWWQDTSAVWLVGWIAVPTQSGCGMVARQEQHRPQRRKMRPSIGPSTEK